MADLDGLFAFTFTGNEDDDAAAATELADTTRTTLDNCFVGLIIGFVGFISDVNDTTSDIGFVSIIDWVDVGAVSWILLAFGGSISWNLIDFIYGKLKG